MVSAARLILTSCTTFHFHRAGAFQLMHRSASICAANRNRHRLNDVSGSLQDPPTHSIRRQFVFHQPIDSHSRSCTRLFGTSSSSTSDTDLKMENIYMEWTIEDDQMLLDNFNDNLPSIAAKLGRGLSGVESRRKKLKDVNSAPYQRLFVNGKGKLKSGKGNGEDGSSSSSSTKTGKLTPAVEVMRRIKWDYSLDPNDFMVEYFDRVEDKVLSCSFGAKNDSVKGKEEMFVFAIPEHRIVAVKYKEQTVWDKQKRLDRVFGSMNGNGETIDKVMETYGEWKERKAEIDAHNKQRQREMIIKLKIALGDHLFLALKDMSTTLQERAKVKELKPQDLDDYVQNALVLFRKGRAVSAATTDAFTAPIESPQIPQNDVTALNLFSDLVALLPDNDLREKVMQQIFNQIAVMNTQASKSDNRQLPDLDEDELTETFVRGSGAGGQKINKTANKVVLVHEPTQLRVECQDTRSLQQNRKIARKRLKLKLDDYINGSQSKTQMKVAKKVNKKQKAKARNKARLRKKKDKKEASDE